jgi:uncharacterized membrane protein
MDLTKQQASKLSAYIAVVSLVPVVAGSILVNVPVIAIGALGAGLAAIVKLKNEPQKPIYNATHHPMRRAEDQKREQVGVL